MKKLLIVVPMLAMCYIVSAQGGGGFHLGAKAGLNMTKIDGQSFSDGFKLGFQVGGYAEIDFSKTFGIQPEVLFTQSNAKTATSITGSDILPDKDAKLNYLAIPILLRINANKLLTFQAGPQFSILMNSDKSFTQNGADAFKNGDFAMIFGAQLNLKSLRVYGRYNIGLSNINDITNDDKWKSQEIQFGIGFNIL